MKYIGIHPEHKYYHECDLPIGAHPGTVVQCETCRKYYVFKLGKITKSYNWVPISIMEIKRIFGDIDD
jgi:hypothetical protein